MTFTAESNDSSLTKATSFAARPGRYPKPFSHFRLIVLFPLPPSAAA